MTGTRRIPLVLATTAAAVVLLAPDAGAVSQQRSDAARRGADWLASQQKADGDIPPNGGTSGALSALSAGGLHPADVSNGGPSAQDFSADDWAANGPSTRDYGVDYARASLDAHGGGIDPSRISAARNFVARMATHFNGENVHDENIPVSLADDMEVAMALHAAGAPVGLVTQIGAFIKLRQKPSGAWSYDETGPDNGDYTAAAIAALCLGGYGPADPDVAGGLDYLKSLQEDSGGLRDVLGDTPVGVNTDTTAWAVSAFNLCGIDPRGADWQTDSDRDPITFLLDRQQASGAFKHTPNAAGVNGASTVKAVIALAGGGFTAEPPGRVSGPRHRTPPAVAPGTSVPLTLVIDHGVGVPVGNPSRWHACKVAVASGSTVGQFLDAAVGGDDPIDCVTGWNAGSGPAGTTVRSLNGVSEKPEASSPKVWVLRLNGGAERTTIDMAVGFGDLVYLRYGPPPPAAGVDADLQPPTVSLTLPPQVDQPSAEARVSASDDRTPTVELRLRYGVDGSPGDFEPFQAVRAVALPGQPGSHRVCVEAQDLAGNLSAPSCASVVLGPAPSGQSGQPGVGGGGTPAGRLGRQGEIPLAVASGSTRMRVSSARLVRRRVRGRTVLMLELRGRAMTQKRRKRLLAGQGLGTPQPLTAAGGSGRRRGDLGSRPARASRASAERHRAARRKRLRRARRRRARRPSVYVALAQQRGRRCRYMTRRGNVRRRSSACAGRKRYLHARGLSTWLLRVPVRRLRSGRYRVVARLTDPGLRRPRYSRATFRLRR